LILQTPAGRAKTAADAPGGEPTSAEKAGLQGARADSKDSGSVLGFDSFDVAKFHR